MFELDFDHILVNTQFSYFVWEYSNCDFFFINFLISVKNFFTLVSNSLHKWKEMTKDKVCLRAVYKKWIVIYWYFQRFLPSSTFFDLDTGLQWRLLGKLGSLEWAKWQTFPAFNLKNKWPRKLYYASNWLSDHVAHYIEVIHSN